MAPPKAENRMGKWGAVSYIVGNIVGSGIFIVPGSILQNTGSAGLSLLVWLLSAAVATLGAYCYCELGTGIRRSGGDFAYLCHVRWNAIAFMFMSIGCVLIYPLMFAIQAETLAEYAVQGLGLCEKSCAVDPQMLFLLQKLIFFLFACLMMFLNFFSLRRVGARFQIGGAIAKFLATGVIVCTALYLVVFKGQTQNFSQPFAGSIWEAGPLVNAFFAGLFSYDGWDVLNFGAEEVENPKRTMPFAIIYGMACVTSIYVVINLSYFVVLDVETVKSSKAVAMLFAQKSLGQFQYLMPFLIILVMVSALNGTIFTASRYLFAAARGRHLPSFLALLNTEQDAPRAAVCVHVLMAFCFSFVGDTNQLINYLGFAQWLQRGFTMCALLWMRLGPVNYEMHPNAVRTPLVMPLIFLFVCFLLVGVTLVQDFAIAKFGLLVLLIALLIYALFIWERTLIGRFPAFRESCLHLNDRVARVTQIALNGRIEVFATEEEEKEKWKTNEFGEQKRTENESKTTTKTIKNGVFKRRTATTKTKIKTTKNHNNNSAATTSNGQQKRENSLEKGKTTKSGGGEEERKEGARRVPSQILSGGRRSDRRVFPAKTNGRLEFVEVVEGQKQQKEKEMEEEEKEQKNGKPPPSLD